MLVVASGADRGRALALEPGRTYVLGRSAECDLRLQDPLVSREHLRITVGPNAIELRDLGTSNGSYLQGVRFDALEVDHPTSLSVGGTQIRLGAGSGDWPMHRAEGSKSLIGSSAPMRELIGMIERVAVHDVGVLLYGETGTGKELVANAIHEASPRRGPFVVCDLAALSRTLIESELFGHRRGAFTSADREGRGAFALAHGGTIFLDEVGELDAALQPRLLRAIEQREIKPVGEEAYRKVDVRIIAASNRDLADEVREGRFRADLYHRLAVVCLRVPALRDRPDDIHPLAEHFLRELAARRGSSPPALSSRALVMFRRYAWPGNVRELRNVLERAFSLDPDARVLDPDLPDSVPAEAPASDSPPSSAAVRGSFKQAKQQSIDAWERAYLLALLAQARGRISRAAQIAGIARGHLHRLLKKHGIDSESWPPGSPPDASG